MKNENNFMNLLDQDGPTCLVIKANLKPVGGLDRFQPAGFPEIGHVIYPAPRYDEKEKIYTTKSVCIVDSAASMANHLETVCMAGANGSDLHPDLENLPHVVSVTHRNFEQKGDSIEAAEDDSFDKIAFTSLSEGHRIASDYFLDGFVEKPKLEKKNEGKGKSKSEWSGTTFREQLRKEFGITEVKKDKTYFMYPEDWWQVYETVFRYDPNSLVHGILLAKEQIKISRFLTAHHEAFGAKRVSSSGVKFDRLGKTLSGQPIFAVDEETAEEIRATFILDLSLLRSYGRNGKGLNDNQKQLLLGLALWKIKRLLDKPFRFRSGCHLKCESISITADDEKIFSESGETLLLSEVNIKNLIQNAGFSGEPITKVYYPANTLFKLGKDDSKTDAEDGDSENQNTEEEESGMSEK